MSELNLATWNWRHRASNTAHSVSKSDTACTHVRVTIVDDLPSLSAIWQAWEPHTVGTVFQTFELFAAWATHIAPAHTGMWFVVVVYDQRMAMPRFLLPLYQHTCNGVTIIEPVDLGVCDFNSPVLAKDFAPSRAEMTAIWSAVLDALPTSDLIQVSKLPSHIAGNPNPMLLLNNVHPIKLSNFKTNLRTPTGTWTPANLPAAVFDDVSRRRRKLDKRAIVTLRTAQTAAEADTFFAAMLEQRAARCHAMGRDNVLDCASTRTFYRALITPGNPASVGSIQALFADDEIIATGYSLIGNHALHMIFPTFKGERWRNYSPGLQLFVDTMAWAATHGLTAYDFTIGDESFKAELGAEQYPLYEYLVAITARGKPTLYHDRLRRFVRKNPRMLRLVARWRKFGNTRAGARS